MSLTADINFSAEFLNAEKYALKVLKNRQTKRDLSSKLRIKGFSSDIISELIAKMERLGYINDRDYAEAFTFDCVHLKRYGKYKVKQALYRHGIDQSLINSVLSFVDEEIYAENLRYFLAREFGCETVISRADAGRFQRKMENRGYSLSQIQDAISESYTVEDYEY